MPIIHTVKARKDYPAEGITKGDTYFKWTTRVTAGKSYIKRVHRSMVRPRPSQLTSSEFLSQAHQLNERIEDFADPAAPDDFLDELKGDAESLRDETQEKLDNLPENLQGAPTGELLQERIDALESFISELEGLDVPEDDEPEEPTPDEYPDGEEGEDFRAAHSEWEDAHDEWESAREGFKDVLQNISLEVF